MQETTLNPEELKRYSRQINLTQIGIEGQKKLKAARVLCIGAGGLGSPLLYYLAAAGVGTIGIIDDDNVELSNLHRQILYTTDDINKKKAETAKSKITAINPNINIITHDERLTESNATKIINNYDIIADGSDNFKTRYLVNDTCIKLTKPNIFASITQLQGQCSVFTKDGPCYRCLFKTPPPNQIPDCADGGVLGAVPGILGSIQATETIKMIAQIGEPLIGQLLTVDTLTMEFKKIKLNKDPNCICADHSQITIKEEPIMQETLNEYEISVQSLNEALKKENNIFLLDVREPHEPEISNIGGHLIPLGELHTRLSELQEDKTIVVYCRSGGRSADAVELLKQSGFKSVKNLVGGMLAWANEIDKSMATY